MTTHMARWLSVAEARWHRHGRWIRVLLAAASLVLVWLTIDQMMLLQDIGESLRTTPAPRGVLNLQVAGDLDKAAEIVDSWKSVKDVGDARPLARESLTADGPLLRLYGPAAFVLGLLILHLLRVTGRRLAWSLLAVAVLSAGSSLCDSLENAELERLLMREPAEWREEREGAAAHQAFLFAQIKYACLLPLLLGIPFGLAAYVRIRKVRPDPATAPSAGDFHDLCAREGLDPGGVQDTIAGEPWLRYTEEARAGLALSGGGIRSATFNLGLLQGLHDLGNVRILERLHYLATVSGGGYIGGWWTAWRSRVGASGGSIFPERTPGGEAAEVRHLREFSNFLTPRRGFFESESWNALVAILGGLVPALLVALSLLATVLFAWVFVAFHVVWPSDWIAPAVIAAMALLLFVLAERHWKARGKGDEDAIADRTYRIAAATATGLVWILWMVWRQKLVSYWFERPVWSRGSWAQAVGGPLRAWWHAIGAIREETAVVLDLRLFEPTIVLLAVAVLLVVPRTVGSSIGTDEWKRSFVTGLDRVIQRLLALAAGWFVFGAIWILGSNLQRFDYAALAAGAGAGGSAGLFALMRDWIGRRLGGPKKGGLLEALKPLVPTILAWAALLLTGALVVWAMVRWLGPSWWAWYVGAFVTIALLAASLFLDLSEVGLHAFYRDRIVRAYLGASNPRASTPPATNRQTEPRSEDDVQVSRIGGRGPLHLICCAANDLAGDALENLSRGARSAVISSHGLAIANHWADQPDLMMGSALTASAAAFNSNMGSVSMSLGPPVAFLMSALNLRLGLWLRHPGRQGASRRVLPGLPFFKEIVGWTTSGVRSDGSPISGDVHLSDGAHFENLALYELVRRHCRYIIVSDCGEDSQVVFDDFGNAARRIREDFGVEIEIDLSPLVPDAARLSRQHMAVGTIHYDGPGGGDKGILLYFKPTLTGDEPRDIQQYRERNQAFPHESTGDQFYDEAQWESYRRLGEHAAHESLRFAVRDGLSDVASLFTGARQQWYPAPPDLGDRLLELTARYTELESEIRDEAPPGFAVEIFPELDLLYQPACAPVDEWLEEKTKIHLLMKMIQLMEDVWLGCHLDTHHTHPLNLGWLNLFQRWAWTPSFRRWWPFLSPLYGSGFRRFAREQFDLAGVHPFTPVPDVVCLGTTQPQGLAWTWMAHRMGWTPPDGAYHYFTFSMTLDMPRGRRMPVEVGVAAIRIAGGEARWTSEEFFVPPSLWGSGLGGRFLAGLLKHLGDPASKCHPAVAKCRVTPVVKSASGRASRQELADLVNFYVGRGFKLVKDSGGAMHLEA